MDAVALVEDLLDVELDEESWDRVDVWGSMKSDLPGVEAESSTGVMWKNMRLNVDPEGRIERPYMGAWLDSSRGAPQDLVGSGTVLRSVIILLDFTTHVEACAQEILNLVHEFIDKYFELCPLGELGVVVISNKIAEPVCGLTADAQKLHEALRDEHLVPKGIMSLQNGLEKCLMILSAAKPYATREILCLWNSTSTHDAGFIDDTIRVLSQQNVRVNLISLKPTIYVLTKLPGKYTVVRNLAAMRTLLLTYTQAQPVVDQTQKPQLIDVGFPELQQSMCTALCTCHNRLKFNTYTCPRCLARNCSIPSTCALCGLVLLKSLDVARSARASYRIPPFLPLPLGKEDCYACERTVLSGAGMCLKCSHTFCLDCDVLIHEHLLPCPGCQYADLLRRQGLSVAKSTPIPSLPETHPHYDFYKAQLDQLSR